METNYFTTLDEIFKHPAVAELGFPPANQEALVQNLLHDNINSRSQVEMLFAINAALQRSSGEAPLDAAARRQWPEIFAQAICHHVLLDMQSPRDLDHAEARWLLTEMSRPGSDHLTEAELAALVLVSATALSTPAYFKQAVLLAVHASILTSRSITPETVNMLNQVIFGLGGFDGFRASREEVEVLLDVNTRASYWPDRGNELLEWQEFFVGTLRAHLLHDAWSPRIVDHAEAGWLAEWLRQMPPPLDRNTSRLLDALNLEARQMPEFLEGNPEEVHGRIRTRTSNLHG